MSCKKPDVARGLKRMKTETDKEIVASYEVNRRIKLRAMEEVRVKMGIKEKYDVKKGKEPKEGEKRDAQMRQVVKTCVRKKGKKGAHSINTSVGVQNRAEIWRTIDRGRDTIEETTSVC